MRKPASIFGACALALAALPARAEPAQPVLPCNGSIMTPVHLDKFGDNNLAVHAVPALGPEIDELFPGDGVCAFARSGVWLRVQYTRGGHGITGWAHSHYLATATERQAPSPAASAPSAETNVTQQQLNQKQIIINVSPDIK